MDWDSLGPLIGWVAALITALWAVIRDMRKHPVDKATALLHSAAETTQAATGIIAQLVARVDSLERDRDETSASIASLRSEVALMRRTWGDWYTDLGLRWQKYRQDECPPPPPQQ